MRTDNELLYWSLVALAVAMCALGLLFGAWALQSRDGEGASVPQAIGGELGAECGDILFENGAGGHEMCFPREWDGWTHAQRVQWMNGVR